VFGIGRNPKAPDKLSLNSWRSQRLRHRRQSVQSLSRGGTVCCLERQLVPAPAGQRPDAIRNFDFDLKCRNFIATSHLHAHPGGVNVDVPATAARIFGQEGSNRELDGALAQQNCSRSRATGGPPRLNRLKVHAALRLNSLPNSPTLSEGTSFRCPYHVSALRQNRPALHRRLDWSASPASQDLTRAAPRFRTMPRAATDQARHRSRASRRACTSGRNG
jgi:hypothetical protein